MTKVAQLVGWSYSSGTTGELHFRGTPANCNSAGKCGKVMAPPKEAWAGGTAYDPSRQATWNSDGNTLIATRLPTCSLVCAMGAAKTLGASSQVSGLAINRKQQRLYQLETAPGAFAIVEYELKPTACPKRLTSCSGKTSSRSSVAGGLAYDEVRGLLYLSVSEPVTGGFRSQIWVTQASKPCAPLCKWDIKTCLGSGRVTGLAYDNCKGALYATQGTSVLEILVGKDPTKCQFTNSRCCSVAGSSFRGLALVPPWERRSLGTSCMQRSCPSCPTMHLRNSGGDPSLGNRDFRYELVNATPGLAGLWYSLNGCNPTGVPLFCGRWHLDPTTMAGPILVPIQGTTNCNGVAKFPAGVLVDPRLCGVKFCAQVVTLCDVGGRAAGLTMSNALEVTITR